MNCQKRMKWKPKGMPLKCLSRSMARSILAAVFVGSRMGMMGDFTPSNMPVFI